LVFISTDVTAQNNYQVKSIKARVTGTSNLHDWESAITRITCNGTFVSKGNVLKSMKNIEIRIEVEGIKSKEGKIMDNKTYEAFNSKVHPLIVCRISTAKIIAVGKNISVEASGNLNMAGVTRKVLLKAKGKLLENGDIQLEGSRQLLMSDFNMKPPSAVLGTIKVGDEVRVNFDLVLTKKLQQHVQIL